MIIYCIISWGREHLNGYGMNLHMEMLLFCIVPLKRPSVPFIMPSSPSTTYETCRKHQFSDFSQHKSAADFWLPQKWAGFLSSSFLLKPALPCRHYYVLWSRTAAPPLPPKPAFMMPEYLTVLPATTSTPPSSQKSLSEQTHPPPPTSKGKKVIWDVSDHDCTLILLLSLTQGQLRNAFCLGILMWSLSVWESYCQSKEVRILL